MFRIPRSHDQLNILVRSFATVTVCLLVTDVPLLAQDNASPHAVVPAYERFRTDKLSDVEAGTLLISELNCQSCHGSVLNESIPQRQAPILTSAANRITPEYLRAFIAAPQSVKPGTAMPHVLRGAGSKDAIEALTHFLSDGGAMNPSPVSAGAIANGRKLFRTVGCAACHGDLEKSSAERPAYAMPIGQPDQKYTVNSLSEFLKNPHAVRPSGRMPSLNLTDKEARDIANYLLQNVKVEANLTVEIFAGRWNALPNFDELKPASTVAAANIDLSVTAKKERFALRFKAFLQVPRDGKYKVWLGSDDGSRMLLDGEEILIGDGIHPHQTVNKTVELKAGPHPIVVEYFEGGGQESLSAEIEGPGISRQPLAGLLTNQRDAAERESGFQVDPELAKQGRELFVTSGCASCHQHDGVKELKQLAKTVPQFDSLKVDGGCLSDSPAANVPKFALTQQQRADIVAAVTKLRSPNGAAEHSPEQKIASTMLTLNCYACHQRDKFGGVPREQDELFTGSIPEMGDEGRIPPHLDGVGDKLQAGWLKEVMNKGAKDRPYMATRMPKFGEKNVGQLVDLIAKVDERTEVDPVKFVDPEHRVIAEARLMVGDKALSCIKCHYFGEHKATGIQSLDMTTMTKRLRRDWFHRYLINPQAYRPGTRMPGAWPNNRTVVPKILHGDPAQQIEGIWRYLTDGKKAKTPSGLTVKAIELKPTDKPVIYRNFIAGLSARGIAVGYPEGAHIAWDAEQMNLRLIWHGAFIDASKHWTGRGQGYQTPMGDHVMELTQGQPLAVLKSLEEAWPTTSARNAGFRFGGYQLNKSGQPSFRYSWQDVSVVDFVKPIPADKDAGLRRTIKLTGKPSDAPLYFRIASADQIETRDDGWLLNGAILVTLNSRSEKLRTVDGKNELVVPVNFAADGSAEIVYEMVW